jgi:hypothetical protein
MLLLTIKLQGCISHLATIKYTANDPLTGPLNIHHNSTPSFSLTRDSEGSDSFEINYFTGGSVRQFCDKNIQIWTGTSGAVNLRRQTDSTTAGHISPLNIQVQRVNYLDMIAANTLSGCVNWTIWNDTAVDGSIQSAAHWKVITKDPTLNKQRTEIGVYVMAGETADNSEGGRTRAALWMHGSGIAAGCNGGINAAYTIDAQQQFGATGDINAEGTLRIQGQDTDERYTLSGNYELSGTSDAGIAAHNADTTAHTYLSKIDGTRPFTGTVGGVDAQASTDLATQANITTDISTHDSNTSAHTYLTKVDGTRPFTGTVGGVDAVASTETLQDPSQMQ